MPGYTEECLEADNALRHVLNAALPPVPEGEDADYYNVMGPAVYAGPFGDEESPVRHGLEHRASLYAHAMCERLDASAACLPFLEREANDLMLLGIAFGRAYEMARHREQFDLDELAKRAKKARRH